MSSAMEELNELIGCFEDELYELQLKKDMTITQKVEALHQMAIMLNQEQVDQWLYREANP